MLSSLDIDTNVWKEIARNAGWHMTRMNINTFARHGVFKDPELVRVVCERLVNREEISKSKVFPYQLLMAYTATVERVMHWHGKVGGNVEVPKEISNALQDAMEIAVENVPEIPGNVYIFPDVSGSMCSPVTGHRKGSTSAVTCIDIAALITAVIMRKNPNAHVWPFSHELSRINLNPRDSVMTNSMKLSDIGGGGTNCSLPLQKLLSRTDKVDYVIYVSDSESWIDSQRGYYGSGTETMKFWKSIKHKNPDAKMACIDIQPYATAQVKPHKDILQVGGFSDLVFDVLSLFGKGELGPENWIGEIEKIEL
jgi:60 kDa SS-A/Ro ribonucleoprotein